MESNWYESIEKYNLGLLPAEQAAQLEAAMRTDEALAAAVRAHRAEWEMQELFAENRLRADIRQRFMESPPEPGIPKNHWNWLYRNWKYALPALLILGGAGFFIFKNTPAPTEALPQNAPAPTAPAPDSRQPAPPEKPIAQQPVPDPPATDSRRLALAAYRVPEGLSGVRGAAGDTDTLTLASRAFAQKNYRRTLLLLSKLPDGDQQEALSLRAHAHFGAGDFAAASHDFSDLGKGGVYRREAQWFGFLSRLAMPGTNKDLLKNELDAIRQQAQHPYQKEAATMWKQLFQ